MIRLPLRRSGLGWTVASVVILAVFLFPIYWMVVTSVKSSSSIFAYPPQIIPHSVTLDVWRNRIFGSSQDVRYVLNSVIIALGTTVLSVTLAAPVAYALACLKFRGKGALVLINLVALMFPAIMIATPLFVIFARLGLLDSYVGLILANTTAALPFSVVLLRPFFLSIPRELTEAARLDGCGHLASFVRVVLPLAKPGVVTAAIFSFLFAWGDFVFALTLTNSDAVRPVTLGLWAFLGAYTSDWPGSMAFSALALGPPLIVFLLAQRHVVAGLSAGGLKG